LLNALAPQTNTQSEQIDNSKEDSELDGVMTLDDDDALFPPEEF